MTPTAAKNRRARVFGHETGSSAIAAGDGSIILSGRGSPGCTCARPMGCAYDATWNEF